MIFPVLEIEDVVQVGDKTRLSACKSFVSKDEDAITKVEIRPEVSGDWIDVTDPSPDNWFLDWVYDGAARTVAPAVRVTSTAADPDADPDPIEAVDQTLTKSLVLVTAADDALFSSDTDLIGLEPDILNWVPAGRASFLNVHRTAQTKIIESLDESGIVDESDEKLTKAAVVDVTEVRAWSRDLVLHLIFKGLINAKDDVFTQKAQFYASEVEKRKARAVLRLDLDGDGEIESTDVLSLTTMDITRR